MLAECAGISERSIRALEHGGSKLQRHTARRLAAALGLGGEKLAWFLGTAAPVPLDAAAFAAAWAEARAMTLEQAVAYALEA